MEKTCASLLPESRIARISLRHRISGVWVAKVRPGFGTSCAAATAAPKLAMIAVAITPWDTWYRPNSCHWTMTTKAQDDSEDDTRDS
eukprot:3618047-Rhodomonas_salina.2